MSNQAHCFHLVDASPWPLTARLAACLIMLSGICWVTLGSTTGIYFGVSSLLLSSYQWWRDVSREATYQGHHTLGVEANMRWGIILFIASEVFFFFSFFWTYLNRGLAPGLEWGFIWPPVGLIPFNPFGIPLLNTRILLTSGLTVTWAHHSILAGDLESSLVGLRLTIMLGVLFTLAQAYEYTSRSFSIADSAYGRIFFMATGFHGFHVIVGSLILFVCLVRALKGHFSPAHHFGLEAGIWYWHFVDVVWIFLFVLVYWWGR